MLTPHIHLIILLSVQFSFMLNKLCERPPQYAPAPCNLDLLTMKVMS